MLTDLHKCLGVEDPAAALPLLMDVARVWQRSVCYTQRELQMVGV